MVKWTKDKVKDSKDSDSNIANGYFWFQIQVRGMSECLCLTLLPRDAIASKKDF